MKSLLFIGGPLDGQTRDVTPETTVYTVEWSPAAHYSRITLFGGVDVRLDVFALNGLTRLDIIHKLITHYKP